MQQNTKVVDLNSKRVEEDEVIAKALAILERRCKRTGAILSSPSAVRSFLRLKLGQLEHEVFSVLFLDAKNRVIVYEEMFRGTLTQTSVYPREIVKAALRYNAAAIVAVHPHPSGNPIPSEADLLLTRAIKQALALVDVRLLDHFVVAGIEIHSMAEHGQI